MLSKVKVVILRTFLQSLITVYKVITSLNKVLLAELAVYISVSVSMTTVLATAELQAGIKTLHLLSRLQSLQI